MLILLNVDVNTPLTLTTPTGVTEINLKLTVPFFAVAVPLLTEYIFRAGHSLLEVLEIEGIKTEMDDKGLQQITDDTPGLFFFFGHFYL